MSSDKLFTVAGTSVKNGVMTFRVCNGEAKKRLWVLKHDKHTDINLIDLPSAMVRSAAIAFLIANNHPGADTAIDTASGKKGKTAEQIAAEEAARVAAAEAVKREEKNRKRREARAAAKATTASASDESFIEAAAETAE